MKIDKLCTYTIDELSTRAQNRVIANRIQELATTTADPVHPELYEFLNLQYIRLKECVWNRSTGLQEFHCETKGDWFPLHTWRRDEFDEKLYASCVGRYEGHMPFWSYIGPETMKELRAIKREYIDTHKLEVLLEGVYDAKTDEVIGMVTLTYDKNANIPPSDKLAIGRTMNAIEFQFHTWIRGVVNCTIEHYQTAFLDIFDTAKAFEFCRKFGSAYTMDGTYVRHLTLNC
ncbi:MAG: hypothetical protein EOM62_17485 [Bacteroidia bacterium]|nr:hypothetical protein [Bacteroidia bacterium]